MEQEPYTSVKLKGSVQNRLKFNGIEKHLKKTGRHNGRNGVMITKNEHISVNVNNDSGSSQKFKQ